MQAERQLISRVLSTGRVRQAIQCGLEAGYFHRHEQEWTYIVGFYMKHSEAPSVDVFCERFPDFRYIKSTKKTVRIKPAAEAVIDNHIAIELAKILKTSGEQLDEMPASEILEHMTAKLSAIGRVQSGDSDVDIVKGIDAHVAEFERLRSAAENPDEDQFIPMPWPAYNEIWGGWRGGELIGILARMNEGKSWLIDQAAVYAALAGKRVYLAPLEMNRYETEARIFSIASFYLARTSKKRGSAPSLKLPAMLDHKTIRDILADKKIYRNRHLMLAHNDIDIAEYKEFAEQVKDAMPGGIVLPDLNVRTEAFTAETFIKKVERSEADIAFLDYAGLLQNTPRGQQRWEMWANISRDLKMAAQYLGIPIVIALQAGRTGVANKTPELEDIADTDAWGRDCDRIISVRQRDTEMFLTNIKSRQSEKNWRITAHFYPDFGCIEQNTHIGIERDVL